ncbi:restriction endonuclease subunit S [Kribbella antibiotica]|nr:restriction endonuclease subunit S [Kribbella antibiotica]
MSGKMYRFRPDERLDPRFLELWLLSPVAQQAIDAMKTGISDSGLNLTHARFTKLAVPVPTLPEQHRIVELLESHLTRLDAAAASLADALRRQIALERSALDTYFGANPAVPLAVLIEEISGGRSFGASNSPARLDEWGIIKVSAMTRGRFRPEENKAVSAEHVDARFEIHQGDLLISRANTADYVGASVLVGRVRPKLLLSDKSLRITPAAGVNAEWLWRALQAPSARRQISKIATGTKDSMRNISRDGLRQIMLPDVDLTTQLAALRAFAGLADALVRMKIEIDAADLRRERLKRALLVAAFSGRLTGTGIGALGVQEMIGV